jgi:hypothetical protein
LADLLHLLDRDQQSFAEPAAADFEQFGSVEALRHRAVSLVVVKGFVV